MKILRGRLEIEINRQDFLSLIQDYQKVIVDVGTGDGSNVLKAALKNKDIFYIGIDPATTNMHETALKIIKKYRDEKNVNILLVISTLENIPDELENCADEILIYFPWGSLLESIIKPIKESCMNLKYIAKNLSSFRFVVTYSELCEKNEIEKRSLPELSTEYFSGLYQQEMVKCGLIVNDTKEISNKELLSFSSRWGKKLAFGRKRKFFEINGVIKK